MTNTSLAQNKIREKMAEHWSSDLSRKQLGFWPTPLESLDRLTSELNGPRIWIKRDDCSGLATGGNKTRKLEFLLADAIAKNAEAIITYGAVQSNHARQTAAACAKFGIDCHLLLTERVRNSTTNYGANGNILLNEILGANLTIVPLDELEKSRDRTIELLNKEGKIFYEIPPGGSSPIGAMGYAHAFQEITDQANFRVTDIVHASASAATQAGLIFGAELLEHNAKILGTNVFHENPSALKSRISDILEKMRELFPSKNRPLDQDNILVNHAYFGEGYGIPNEETLDAIRLFASLEGILLDPVYSGKAAACLIDQINIGAFDESTDIVFLHTGGQASLSAYQDDFMPN